MYKLESYNQATMYRIMYSACVQLLCDYIIIHYMHYILYYKCHYATSWSNALTEQADVLVAKIYMMCRL